MLTHSQSDVRSRLGNDDPNYEIPTRPLPYGSEGVKSPTYVPPTPPSGTSSTGKSGIIDLAHRLEMTVEPASDTTGKPSTVPTGSGSGMVEERARDIATSKPNASGSASGSGTTAEQPSDFTSSELNTSTTGFGSDTTREHHSSTTTISSAESVVSPTQAKFGDTIAGTSSNPAQTLSSALSMEKPSYTGPGVAWDKGETLLTPESAIGAREEEKYFET
jgi:hypothetical protein